MIFEIDRALLHQIKNPAFASYATIYSGIYSDFMQQVRRTGIGIDSRDYTQQVHEKFDALRRKGAIFRNQDKSIVINNISPACEACQTGVGSATFFISLKCHRDCFYCFNPNQENYAYFSHNKRKVVEELEQIYASGRKVNQLALTGGEPLLHKDETLEFFRVAQRSFPQAYTRLYTCGDHVDDAILERLKAAGLDEIRFSIRMHDAPKARRHTYDRIALARDYIPKVMVEMPVLPDTLDEMRDLLVELAGLGIFGINLLEFCFPLNRAESFRERGYKIKAHPYRVLYSYWYAGGLPVAGSETVCLDLIEFALESGMQLGVHYCSLENKHTGQVYQQNFCQPIPKTAFFSKKDYFLKSAKVFGEDIPKVKRVFRKNGYQGYLTNKDHDYLEFHVSKISLLKNLNLEIGISTAVIENRNGENYIRELRIDLTTPQNFDLEKDI